MNIHYFSSFVHVVTANPLCLTTDICLENMMSVASTEVEQDIRFFEECFGRLQFREKDRYDYHNGPAKRSIVIQ